MTSERERLLLALIHLMQKEIECLRSVLSEWDQDKNCYVQFTRAEKFEAARETMEHEL